MPFDGNGNWTSNFSAVADRDANIKILASRFDGILLADIAQSFENCLTKDMQVKPQQAFNANNYRVINVSDPIDVTDAVNKQTLDGKDALCVHKAGTETITGDKTFSGSNTFSNIITGSITGNAGTVTNGVYTTGDQTIGGTKTFSSTISGSITGNAGTVTNGVYTTGNQTIGGTKTFSSTISGSITGNAGTVTNGVYTNTDQTITGNKTFSGSVSLGSSATVTTPSSSDNSTKVANTSWVKSNMTGIPDYANRTEFTTAEYTPTAHGVIVVKGTGGAPFAEISTNDGFVIVRSKATDSSSGVQVVWAIVKSGDTYKTSGSGTIQRWFIPFA